VPPGGYIGGPNIDVDAGWDPFYPSHWSKNPGKVSKWPYRNNGVGYWVRGMISIAGPPYSRFYPSTTLVGGGGSNPWNGSNPWLGQAGDPTSIVGKIW